MKFHWMKIISLAAIAMVRGQNNEISFFDERERERGGGRRDCPTFVENICISSSGAGRAGLVTSAGVEQAR